MRKRYIYILLFGLPGLFVAGIISIVVFGALAGILWIYVFGDNPWPASAGTFITIVFVIVFMALWIGFIVLGYGVGRKLEGDPVLNRKHVFISLGLTLIFLLFILFQQWSVGNLGPESAGVLCSEFCIQHGYVGSGMPPEVSGDRTCSCYDESGNEALRIPLDHIDPGAPK
jgi:hypothetical protein